MKRLVVGGWFPCRKVGDRRVMRSIQIRKTSLTTLFPWINMSPEKGPCWKEISFSNHQFSGDILVFREVLIVPLNQKCLDNLSCWFWILADFDKKKHIESDLTIPWKNVSRGPGCGSTSAMSHAMTLEEMSPYLAFKIFLCQKLGRKYECPQSRKPKIGRSGLLWMVSGAVHAGWWNWTCF